MKNNNHYGERVIKNRWMIIIGVILLVIATAYGGKYLTFNNDGRVFFNKADPQLIALEEIENTYNRNDNILFAVEPKKGDVFNREVLSAAEELTQRAWQIPHSSRVDSFTNFQHTKALGDDLIVKDLVENASELSDQELQDIKKVALSDPMLIKRVISKKGNMVGVNVTILKPDNAVKEIAKIMQSVKAIIKEFRNKYPELNFYLTGAIPFDNAFGEVSMNDMSTLVPTMYFIMIFATGLLLRSALGALGTLLIIGFSTLTAMGITGWLGIQLTPASASAPTIILTLSVSDSVHILVTMFQEMRLGKSKHEAIIESMRVNLQPVFLTSVTTMIGFLSMNASDAAPFRDLGNIVAIGVMVAFVYSVLFLPAFMSVLPLGIKAAKNKCCEKMLLVDKIADFVVRRRRGLFWGMLLGSVFLIAGIHRIDLNDRFVEYFDKSYSIRTDTDYIIDNELSGMDVIEYSIKSGQTNGITDPQYLSSLERFANWYRSQPEVSYVVTFTDTMKQLNKSMHGDDNSYYRIPVDRFLAAQFLLLYEMSLPFGLDLNNQIDVDKSSTRFTVVIKRMPTRQLRELEERAQSWMRQNFPEHMFAYGSGISIVWSHISERNINTMLFGTLIALLLISGILIGALRSFKYGLISLIPNLTPAFMAFGLWGYLYEEAGLGVSVVGAMSLGVVVDDTIHFLTKYIRARDEFGTDSKEAVKRSFHTVGTAITTTTVVLVMGFLVLTYSGFLLNSAMGLLTAIALAFALVADLFFLPPLLMKLDTDCSRVLNSSE